MHLVLISFAYFQFAIRLPGQFWGRLPNGQAYTLQALARPNVSTKALLSWATLSATATFSFDFVNYKDQLKALREYFTIDGYRSFLTLINDSPTWSTIEEKKLIASAVAIGPAILLREELRGDSHSWRIQVPLLVRYQSADGKEKRQQMVEMLITQVSTQDAPKGIGISQYVARGISSELNR